MPHGPRAYRTKIRGMGPLLGLVPPAAMGALAWLLVHGNASTVRGVAGFLLGVLAAPVMLVAGVPLEGSTAVYAVSVVASGLLWLLIGVTASRRATRTPVASWRDFWREYLWLAGGVWLGTVGALVAANLVLGRTLV
ncbi:MAG: hypothetical protein RL238_3485 [Actinomycetota bacterium]